MAETSNNRNYQKCKEFSGNQTCPQKTKSETAENAEGVRYALITEQKETCKDCGGAI